MQSSTLCNLSSTKEKHKKQFRKSPFAFFLYIVGIAANDVFPLTSIVITTSSDSYDDDDGPIKV